MFARATTAAIAYGKTALASGFLARYKKWIHECSFGPFLDQESDLLLPSRLEAKQYLSMDISKGGYAFLGVLIWLILKHYYCYRVSEVQTWLWDAKLQLKEEPGAFLDCVFHAFTTVSLIGSRGRDMQRRPSGSYTFFVKKDCGLKLISLLLERG